MTCASDALLRGCGFGTKPLVDLSKSINCSAVRSGVKPAPIAHPFLGVWWFRHAGWESTWHWRGTRPIQSLNVGLHVARGGSNFVRLHRERAAPHMSLG